MFFPDNGEAPRTLPVAQAICARCPVRQDCSDAGRGETFGVWGGRSARQRKLAKRTAA